MSPRNNTEISIKNMAIYILKKWKVVVLIVLFFSFLSGVYGFVSNEKRTEPKSKAEIASIKAQLTEEEVTEVENAANLICEYRNLYDTQKKYNDESIYQKLDSFDIPTIVLEYYIDNYYRVSYPIIEASNNIIPLVKAYSSVLKEESLYEMMAKEIDKSIKPSYYSEMIDVDVEEQEFGVFTVTIYAADTKMLDKMADFIVKSLESKSAETLEKYGQHELILTSSTMQNSVDYEVFKAQQDNLNKLNDTKVAIDTLEAAYSGTKLTYLKSLIHEEIEEDFSLIKTVLIGAFIGMIVSLGYYSIKYLKLKSVKSINEIEKMYGYEGIGSLNNEDKIELLSTKIQLAMQHANESKLCILCDKSVDLNKVEVLKDSINDLKIIVVADLENSAKDLIELSNSDAAVLIEKVYSTEYSSIAYQIDRCHEYGIKIIGFVEG